MKSGMFNSEITGIDTQGMPIFDRAQDADFFAKYFSSFVSNGVFANPSTNLQVVQKTGMSVDLKAGACFMLGYFGWEDVDVEFTLTQSHITLPRIDRIVVRLDLANRVIESACLVGTPNANPVATAITRPLEGQSGDIFEMAVGDIYVGAGVVSISQSNITDQRLNNAVCGIVHGMVEQVDTTTIFNQFNSWLLTIQDLLDENTAANLLGLILDLTARTDTIDGLITALGEGVVQNGLDIDAVEARASKLEAEDIPIVTTGTQPNYVIAVTRLSSETPLAVGFRQRVKFHAIATADATVAITGSGGYTVTAKNLFADEDKRAKPKKQYVDIEYNGTSFFVVGSGGGDIELPSTLAAGSNPIYTLIPLSSVYGNNAGSYITHRTWTALKAATWRISWLFWAAYNDPSNSGYSRITKNGVVVGTPTYTTMSTLAQAVFTTLDVAVAAGDIVRFEMYSSRSTRTAYCQELVVAVDAPVLTNTFMTVS